MSEAEVKEWARNGSFMKKPSSGWLHDDDAIEMGAGVFYPVKVYENLIIFFSPAYIFHLVRIVL